MKKGKKKDKKTRVVNEKKPKKKAVVKAKQKSKLKQDLVSGDNSGIIVVEDDSNMDKEAEMEARRAYLEEARSQEAAED